MSLTQLGEQIVVPEVSFLFCRLVGELLQMFFHQIAAPDLSHLSHALFFPRSPSCAFLLFWHVFWVHLTGLPPHSPPTIFYVSAMNIFSRMTPQWGGGGPTHKQMHIQNHFQHTRCYCITNSSVALRALALLGRGYFREHLSPLKSHIFTKFPLVCVTHTQTASASVGLLNCCCVRYSHPIEGIWRG